MHTFHGGNVTGGKQKGWNLPEGIFRGGNLPVTERKTVGNTPKTCLYRKKNRWKYTENLPLQKEKPLEVHRKLAYAERKTVGNVPKTSLYAERKTVENIPTICLYAERKTVENIPKKFASTVRKTVGNTP